MSESMTDYNKRREKKTHSKERDLITADKDCEKDCRMARLTDIRMEECEGRWKIGQIWQKINKSNNHMEDRQSKRATKRLTHTRVDRQADKEDNMNL